MVGPDEAKGDEPPRGSLVPALLLVIATTFVAALLVSVAYRDVVGWMPDWIPRIFVALTALTVLVLFHWLIQGREPPDAEPGPEAWICKHCLKPYVPGAHFCPRCAAPQTFFAGTGKYEVIYAQAWCIGKAAHHPSRLMHVVVLVGIGVAAALSQIAFVWLTVQSASQDGAMRFTWVGIGSTIVHLVYASILVALALISVKSWMRRARGEEPLRPEIEYGAPPWWSCDAQWALPEFEEEPGDATPEAGGAPSPRPPDP